jgi:ABC-type multidrug transport system ATPase subunit
VEKAIKIQDVYKSYGDNQALKGINLQVDKAEIFGLIGPDGAGKTTLIRILTSLLLPDEGEVEVYGNNVVKYYKRIRKISGYMPGKFSLYEDLSVEENLNFFAGVFGTSIKENYHLIKDIYKQIEPFKKRRAGKLSGGMKQKLALSCALIHKPEILFLDEPTTGVDAVSRKEFWAMLKKLKQKNITIFVSTPYMDEASLCDRVALIQKGEILSVNTPKAIVDEFDKPLISVSSNKMHLLCKHLEEIKEVESAHLFGESVHVVLNSDLSSFEKIKSHLENKEHANIEVKKIKPNIEDRFINLMQQ